MLFTKPLKGYLSLDMTLLSSAEDPFLFRFDWFHSAQLYLSLRRDNERISVGLKKYHTFAHKALEQQEN